MQKFRQQVFVPPEHVRVEVTFHMCQGRWLFGGYKVTDNVNDELLALATGRTGWVTDLADTMDDVISELLEIEADYGGPF